MIGRTIVTAMLFVTQVVAWLIVGCDAEDEMWKAVRALWREDKRENKR